VSKEALVEAYLRGRITRRIFVRRLVAAGLTVSAAATYARMLHPDPAQASPKLRDFYDFYDDHRHMEGHGLVVQGHKFAHFKFTLQCSRVRNPNTLHVRWGRKGHATTHDFDLTSVTASKCSDDPAIPTPPAGFDTLEGEGLGKVDGVQPATAKWKFTDGSNGDTATVLIKDAATSAELLSISGPVHKGGNLAVAN
jgi:hypothetical protein